jgi:uncharacterized protein (DUF2141 family)
MNSKGFGRRGWLIQLVAAIGLVVVMSSVATAATVSGTVTNYTNRTGRVFMYLQQQYGGDTGIGVSVPTPAPNTPFTIRGVPNGSYILNAFVDGSGTGRLHANDPTWSSPGTIDINNNNYSGTNSTVTFEFLPNVPVQKPAGAQIFPGDNGAFVGWDRPEDGNGNTIADSYRVYYSTTNPNPKAGGVFITVPAGDQDFALFHIPNNTTLYVQVTALVGATESAASSVATMIINPPAAGFSISGTINLSGISNPTGNLYVFLVDRAGKGGPVAVSYVATPPQLSNNFTINTNSTNAPPGTYSLYALIDMNGDGRIGSGDVMTNGQQAPTVTINGTNLTGQAITLTRSNSSPSLTTTHSQDSDSPPNDGYYINISVESMTEVPVNVTATNGPSTNGLTYPIDLGINSWGEFQPRFNVNTNRPKLTDSYSLDIQYANVVAHDIVNLPVTAVLDSFATPTAPVGNLPYSAIVNPSVHSWTAPASPPTSYTYSFWINANGFNNNDYSDMPSNTSSISIPGLTYNNGQQYNWNINVQDSFGNQAQKSAWFTYTTAPAINSFTPTTVLPGTMLTISGINFNTTPANNTVNFCGASAQATTASATQLQVVVPQNACSGSIQVNANGQYSNYNSTQLTVLSTISFSGKITAQGAPNTSLSGVTVNLFSALLNSTTTSTTDSNTNYTVSGIPAGQDFSISFAKTAYDTAWTGINNSDSDIIGRNISLNPAGTLSTWNGGDTTKGAIRGRVQRVSDGTPIVGAVVTSPGRTVMYDGGDGKTPVGGSATGTNGVFYILQLPDNASVAINAAAAGFIFNAVTAVSHAGSITNVGVRGLPAISVSGTIINSSNAPLAGADIEQEGTSNEVTSNAGGAFTINNIAGGNSFELKMSLDPTYVPVYSGWLNSPTSLTLPYPYILFTPAELSGVLGIASGKGAIIGRVVNSANFAAAISGATVTASGQSPSYAVRYYDSGTGQFSLTATATDSSGMFLVRDVEDGANINIDAAAGTNIYGYTFVTTHAYAVSEIAVPCYVPSAGWGNLQSPGSLTVTTSQTTDNVFGQVYMYGVTDAAPGPAPGLVAELGYGPVGSDHTGTSWVWKIAAYNTQIYSSQAGSNVYQYSTNLSVTTAGSYDYVYRYSYFGGQYTYGDLSGTFYGIPYNPGRLTVNAPSLAISGFVYTTSGIPVQGATVTVVGNPALTATTAADGSYTISGIPVAQDFQVMASMAGFVPAYSILFNSTGSNILGRGLTLFTAAEVSGKISSTTGAIFGQTILTGGLGIPVEGAIVSIISPTGKYTVRYDDGTGVYLPGGPTGATGRFLIPNVSDGDTVVLSASRSNWASNQKTYVAHANAVTLGSLAGTYSTTTTVTLASGSNPSYYGDPLTFTATVSPSSANGTVQFKLDGVNVGSAVTLVNGSATSAAFSSMMPATHTVTAAYSGVPGYTVSTSAGTTQTVADKVKIGSSGNYLTLQAAISAAVDFNILLLRDARFAEDLIVNRTLPFTITLKGGLSGNFNTLAGPTATTSVKSLKIRQGKVIANRLVVKPD